MGKLVRSKLRDKVHICRIASLVRAWCLTLTSMFEVETVTTAPFPWVVKIEHSHHIALAHLHKQIVETCQYGIIIHPRCLLKGWLHLGGHTPLAIAAHKDAQVVNTCLLQRIEFLTQSLSIAALSLWTEDSPVPEICTYIVVRLSVADKLSVLYLYKLRLCHTYSCYRHQ